MLRASLLSFVVLALTGLDVCLADVSLIMPGFDEQPLSVSIIGAGADGETTYQVVPGQPTGTWIGQEPAFYGTATLVEGANNAILDYADAELSISLVESCTFAGGIANCIDAIAGETTFTAQEPATPLLVQGGGTATAPPAPTPTAIGSGIPAKTTAAAPGSSVPGSSMATQSGPSQSISPTKAANSGTRLFPSTAVTAGMLAILVALL